MQGHIAFVIFIFFLGFFGIKQQAIYSNSIKDYTEKDENKPTNSRYEKSGLKKNDIILVRTSLYEPILNFSSERKMRLNPLLLSESNWVGSLPMAMRGPRTEFGILTFYLKVAEALLPNS